MLKYGLFIILFLVVLTYGGLGQAPPKDENLQSLYERAISACVQRQLNEYGDQGQETYARLKDRLFLANMFLTPNLPTEFDGVKVTYVTNDELWKRV